MKQKIVWDLKNSLNQKIVGQPELLMILLLALFSWSHVFIQSLPGLAKTSAVKYLCELVWLSFGRIQWTPDLLPTDITGFEMADGSIKSWIIMNNLILFDEINRATPKLQSAILQGMEEKMLSIWSHTITLPNPFIVFATANPNGSRGVYGLPEAQMDRFGLSITLDYPEDEQEIIWGRQNAIPENDTIGIIDFDAITKDIELIAVEPTSIELVTNYLKCTRNTESILIGCSPRAGKDLIRLAKTIAWMQWHSVVSTRDIMMLIEYARGHRVTRKNSHI